MLGPGSLYTSLLPSLLLPAIRDALLASPALRIYRLQRRDADGRDRRLRPRRPRRGAGRATRRRASSTSCSPTTSSCPRLGERWAAAAGPRCAGRRATAGAAARARRRRRPGERAPSRPSAPGGCPPARRGSTRPVATPRRGRSIRLRATPRPGAARHRLIGPRARARAPTPERGGRPAGRLSDADSERDLVDGAARRAGRHRAVAVLRSRGRGRRARARADRPGGVGAGWPIRLRRLGRRRRRPDGTAFELGGRRRALPPRLAPRPVPRARLAEPGRRPDPPRVRRRRRTRRRLAARLAELGLPARGGSDAAAAS